FEVGIDFRGDALELAQGLDFLQPGVEIARIRGAGHGFWFGFAELLALAARADRDTHVHIRLPSCSVSSFAWRRSLAERNRHGDRPKQRSERMRANGAQ